MASRNRKTVAAIKDTDQMGGFAKGLAVIEAFGNSRNPLPIADIARLAGLDRASARRCLLTLVSNGYATSDGRYFQLSPRILRLSTAYLSTSIPRLIRPHLEKLADDIRESCSTSVLDGDEIIYIARATQHRLIGVGLRPGSRLPAYCTSMGRVLLAALPVKQCREVLRASKRTAVTERTLVGINELMAEFEKVRASGYALIDQELEVGYRSIAIPVVNVSGETVAALNVGVHAARATLARLREEILPRMLETQAELSGILP